MKSTPLISPDRNRVSTNQNRASPTTTNPIHTTRGEGAQPSRVCHSDARHRHGRRTTMASMSAGTRIAGSRRTGGQPTRGAPTRTAPATRPSTTRNGRHAWCIRFIKRAAGPRNEPNLNRANDMGLENNKTSGEDCISERDRQGIRARGYVEVRCLPDYRRRCSSATCQSTPPGTDAPSPDAAPSAGWRFGWSSRQTASSRRLSAANRYRRRWTENPPESGCLGHLTDEPVAEIGQCGEPTPSPSFG